MHPGGRNLRRRHRHLHRDGQRPDLPPQPAQIGRDRHRPHRRRRVRGDLHRGGGQQHGRGRHLRPDQRRPIVPGQSAGHRRRLDLHRRLRRRHRQRRRPVPARGRQHRDRRERDAYLCADDQFPIHQRHCSGRVRDHADAGPGLVQPRQLAGRHRSRCHRQRRLRESPAAADSVVGADQDGRRDHRHRYPGQWRGRCRRHDHLHLRGSEHRQPHLDQRQRDRSVAAEPGLHGRHAGAERDPDADLYGGQRLYVDSAGREHGLACEHRDRDRYNAGRWHGQRHRRRDGDDCGRAAAGADQDGRCDHRHRYARQRRGRCRRHDHLHLRGSEHRQRHLDQRQRDRPVAAEPGLHRGDAGAGRVADAGLHRGQRLCADPAGREHRFAREYGDRYGHHAERRHGDRHRR